MDYISIVDGTYKFTRSKMISLKQDFAFTKLIKDENNPKKIIRKEKMWKSKTAKNEHHRLKRELKSLKRELNLLKF